MKDSTYYIIALAFVVIAITVLRIWLYRRKKAIHKFEDKCRQTILEKPAFPYPIIHGITDAEFYENEIKKYEAARPYFLEMLYSTKKLSIENWFSIKDQRHLFGLMNKPQNKKNRPNPPIKSISALFKLNI